MITFELRVSSNKAAFQKLDSFNKSLFSIQSLTLGTTARTSMFSVIIATQLRVNGFPDSQPLPNSYNMDSTTKIPPGSL